MSIEQQNQIRALEHRVAALEDAIAQLLREKLDEKPKRETLTLPKKANG